MLDCRQKLQVVIILIIIEESIRAIVIRGYKRRVCLFRYLLSVGDINNFLLESHIRLCQCLNLLNRCWFFAQKVFMWFPLLFLLAFCVIESHISEVFDLNIRVWSHNSVWVLECFALKPFLFIFPKLFRGHDIIQVLIWNLLFRLLGGILVEFVQSVRLFLVLDPRRALMGIHGRHLSFLRNLNLNFVFSL